MSATVTEQDPRVQTAHSLAEYLAAALRADLDV